MKHSTYKKLYNAHLGAVDKQGLLISRKQESDPFYQNIINLIVHESEPIVAWDIKPFTTDFLIGSPKERLDETFFAFILRLVSFIKEQIYIRIYQKPESHSVVMAYVSMLRNVLINSLALLYNVQWTPELLTIHLENTIIKFFNEGDPFALRKLMTSLGINLAKDIYPAENVFEKLNFLQILQFSSFYWRFLHWMAEADSLRGEDMALYKKGWRNLLKGSIYRTLSCEICSKHFRNMLDKYENELTDGDLPKLFFTMHNETHAMRRQTHKYLQEPDYTESQYNADAQIMRQALSPK